MILVLLSLVAVVIAVRHYEKIEARPVGHQAPEGWCRIPAGFPHVDCEIRV